MDIYNKLNNRINSNLDMKNNRNSVIKGETMKLKAVN